MRRGCGTRVQGRCIASVRGLCFQPATDRFGSAAPARGRQELSLDSNFVMGSQLIHKTGYESQVTARSSRPNRRALRGRVQRPSDIRFRNLTDSTQSEPINSASPTRLLGVCRRLPAPPNVSNPIAVRQAPQFDPSRAPRETRCIGTQESPCGAKF